MTAKINQSLIIWLISQAYAAETSFTLSLKLFLISFSHTPIFPLSLWTEWSIEQCAKLAALLHQGHSFLFILTYFFISTASLVSSVHLFCGIFEAQKRCKKGSETFIMTGQQEPSHHSLPPSLLCLYPLLSRFLTSQSILPCELIMLCGWGGRGCFVCSCLQRWSIVTDTHHSWFYCALFHDVSCTTTSRTGSVCQGAHQLNWQL